jgi:hypothetical protein
MCSTAAMIARWKLGRRKSCPGPIRSIATGVPNEGTEASRDAMQAYLDWEYGLVEQLKCDGTHGFFVI